MGQRSNRKSSVYALCVSGRGKEFKNNNVTNIRKWHAKHHQTTTKAEQLFNFWYQWKFIMIPIKAIFDWAQKWWYLWHPILWNKSPIIPPWWSSVTDPKLANVKLQRDNQYIWPYWNSFLRLLFDILAIESLNWIYIIKKQLILYYFQWTSIDTFMIFFPFWENGGDHDCIS